MNLTITCALICELLVGLPDYKNIPRQDYLIYGADGALYADCRKDITGLVDKLKAECGGCLLKEYSYPHITITDNAGSVKCCDVDCTAICTKGE